MQAIQHSLDIPPPTHEQVAESLRVKRREIKAAILALRVQHKALGVALEELGEPVRDVPGSNRSAAVP